MRKFVEVPSETLLYLLSLAPPDGERWQRESDAQQHLLAAEKAADVARMPLYHFEGRNYHNSRRGAWYTSCRVYKDGDEVWNSGLHGGSGDYYLTLGINWLKVQGWLPQDAWGGTLYVRETLHSTYDVREVTREKDL